MTSFTAMSGSGEGVLSETIIFFAFIALICTCFVILWLIKGSKDIKSQNRGSNIPKNNKRKSSLTNKPQEQTQPPKKKVVTKQTSKGSASQSPKFEHPHLVSTLKGHTGHLTGGEFSSNGKQFITAAEVARAFVIPNVKDEKESKLNQYKAINHDEKGTMWSTDSLSSSSNAPSDTEDSLTSSSSCSLKMSRRQKKNKKRKKGNNSDKNSVKSKSKSVNNNNNNSNNNNTNNNSNNSNNNSNNNNNNNNDNNNNNNNSNNNNKKSEKNKLVENEIIIESVIHKEKKSKKCKLGQNVCIKVNNKVNIDFHKLLLPFCTNVQERILSGFPYQTYRGTYVFKSFGFSRLESVLGDHRLVDAEITDVDLKICDNAMDEDEDLSSKNFMQKNATVNDISFKYKSFCSSSGNVQKCERCRQFFDVGQNGRTLCIFHPKKAILTNEGALRYICCNSFKNGGGCQAYTFHVYHHLSIGINGPLQGYISTQPLKRLPKVFGLDCEMVFTTQGFEVARTTLVDVFGEVVLDIFVQPEGIILDYNTQFSGITEDSLYNALSFSEMQNLFLQYISSSDILVGHSLDGDLVVLKVLHRRVVDSSLLFLDIPRDMTTNGSSPLPRRQALKSLVKQHLGQDIQVSGSCGHNSKEDATASLNLVLNKVCGESFKEAQRGKKMSNVPGL